MVFKGTAGMLDKRGDSIPDASSTAMEATADTIPVSPTATFSSAYDSDHYAVSSQSSEVGFYPSTQCALGSQDIIP